MKIEAKKVRILSGGESDIIPFCCFDLYCHVAICRYVFVCDCEKNMNTELNMTD